MKVEKKDLRERMRAKLIAQSETERTERSRKIFDRLTNESFFQKASFISCYVALPEEVQTAAIIDEALKLKKHVAVPKTDLKNRTVAMHEIKNPSEDLRKTSFGLMEPDPKKSKAVAAQLIDCVIVPGVAFDEENYRLGRGYAFYDRYLALLKPETAKVGLGFRFQKVKKLPIELHDQKLDTVITD